jgi:hypothetical protein
MFFSSDSIHQVLNSQAYSTGLASVSSNNDDLDNED